LSEKLLMLTKRCKVCSRIIPLGRIVALPYTDRCVRHSDAVPITEDTVGVINSVDTHDLLMSIQSSTQADRWN